MKKRLPDIDVFAKRFATEINRTLCADSDPRVKHIGKLLEAKEHLTAPERRALVQAFTGRCRPRFRLG